MKIKTTWSFTLLFYVRSPFLMVGADGLRSEARPPPLQIQIYVSFEC